MGGEKMKKCLTLLLTAMFVFAIFGGMGISVAKEDSPLNIEVGSTLALSGNGTMSRSMLVQSDFGYSGQRLVEEMYSGYRGTLGPSTIEYKSDMNMFVGASDTLENESTTEIAYASTAFTTVMKREVCAKNYDVGAVSAVRISGNSATAFEVDMSPESNYLTIEGTVEGKTRLSHSVVDPVTKLKAVKDIIRVNGQVEFNYEAFAEQMIDVGDLGDWLGCP